MDKIKIRGGRTLKGEITASGSKNASLPILISSLLSDEPCKFLSIPRLEDVRTVVNILNLLGVESKVTSDQICLTAKTVKSFEASYDLVRKMRASVLVMGPLLARFGEAKVSLPGGCAIGTRPINYHLMGFEAMGAHIDLEGGYVIARAKKLHGAKVAFPQPSVGATENILMAASLAKGETVIENAAKEPEIAELVRCLREMGTVIEGEGTSTIYVQGRDRLHGCQFEVMGDRIEAGTYLAAAIATQGSIRVNKINSNHLTAVLDVFEQIGAKTRRDNTFVEVSCEARPRPAQITTEPYPGFPTDMQAQLMTVLALADGKSLIRETIFENRFMHVPELNRLGAQIETHENEAIITGRAELVGAPVMATDLRASASLVIAGLCARGETTINRVYHLDRGYENLEGKLGQLGAFVERLPEA